MRIVSLIPSATEILFAVGAGDDVVGVTFECDHPAAARERRVVSTSAMPEGLSPREIDDFVGAALAAGEDLYRLDAGALVELDADLVVTQDLCAVCAVDVGTVDEALSYLGCRAEVATIDPHTFDDVLFSISEVGRLTDRAAEAATLVASLEARLDTVAEKVAGRTRPRVLVLEWTDPPFAPGHWIPEMVTRAGGEPTLGVAGTRSSRIT
ncbi:MAG TPA: ABC transporter substrate-binding protein, partial [Nocardioides sp.]|nr:ABC transporter substrate-binding protein [Nocardioides sp.]